MTKAILNYLEGRKSMCWIKRQKEKVSQKEIESYKEVVKVNWEKKMLIVLFGRNYIANSPKARLHGRAIDRRAPVTRSVKQLLLRGLNYG
ncbi:MAG: hypothetical protein MUP57_03375 [Clostridia bacterium]|nr:hypothetical protein [Clostridia bacterium]